MPMPMTTYSGSCVSNDTDSSVRMPQSFLLFSTGSFGHLMEGCMPVTCRTALHTHSPAECCQMQKLLRRLMRTDQIAQIKPAGLGQKASAAPPASGSLADGKDRGFIRRAV